MINFILIIAVLFIAAALVLNTLKKKQTAEVEEKVEVNEITYNIDKMTAFVKKRLDEITKVNLYDIGLSEAELERRKNKKYELKKALKGCTYGDVNDKKYVKNLIYDLLLQEYGVNEINISKAIPFDLPSLLTSQDKFDILIYMYQKEFGYEALTQMIKKYDLATLKYVQGEAKPSYVITSEEISDTILPLLSSSEILSLLTCDSCPSNLCIDTVSAIFRYSDPFRLSSCLHSFHQAIASLFQILTGYPTRKSEIPFLRKLVIQLVNDLIGVPYRYTQHGCKLRRGDKTGLFHHFYSS